MRKNNLFLVIMFFFANIMSLHAQEKFAFVQNYWTKGYLFGGQDFGCSKMKPTLETNSFNFIPVENEKNTFYIKLTDTERYLNIEKGSLELGEINKDFHSSHWILEPVKGIENCYRIRNRWKPTLYLNNEKVSKTNGVDCSAVNDAANSSYWLLDSGF